MSSRNDFQGSSELEGKIGGNQSSKKPDTFETLDEPVSETILRDLRQVGQKLQHVLLPKNLSEDTARELRQWDLWGPLILCVSLACTLSWGAKESQTATVFAAVFVIVWGGAGMVTLNAALLKGNVSFFQSVCVLGYCIAPLCVASLICHFFTAAFLRFIIVCVALLWALRASVTFMGSIVVENRRGLAVYPVVIFYLVIGWMILVQ